MNYVKYQGRYPGYVDSSNPYQNTVLSCAVGVNSFSHFFGLGAVNSHAKTTHHGFFPASGNIKPRTPYSDQTWMQYGGADFEPTENNVTRMERGLNTLKMVFYYPSIQPGETISLDFGYVFNHDEVNTLLHSLTSMFIIQPTDVLSGSRSLVVAAVSKSQVSGLINCSMSLFGYVLNNSASAFWVPLPLVNETIISDVNSQYFYCSAYVNVTMFADGDVQLSVTANTINGTITKLKAITIANSGTRLCFEQASQSGFIHFYKFNSYNFSMSENCMDFARSSSSMQVLSVTYYLETLHNGEVSSYMLQPMYSAPYNFMLTVNEYIFTKLTNSTLCFIKAVVNSATTSNGIPLLPSISSFATVTVFSALYNPIIEDLRLAKHIPLPTAIPVTEPTYEPTYEPISYPTAEPVEPTYEPTGPTETPIIEPTEEPTHKLTIEPTIVPTLKTGSESPTETPTEVPTIYLPSNDPIYKPTNKPTGAPSKCPTLSPTRDPSNSPTSAPSVSPEPSAEPSLVPTLEPSATPSYQPSWMPSAVPSWDPSASPTGAPSVSPSQEPNAEPSLVPTLEPSLTPSYQPSWMPSAVPSSASSINSIVISDYGSYTCFCDDSLVIGSFVQSTSFAEKGICRVSLTSTIGSFLSYDISAPLSSGIDSNNGYFYVESCSGVLHVNKSLILARQSIFNLNVSIFSADQMVGFVLIQVRLVRVHRGPKFVFPGLIPNYFNFSIFPNSSYKGVVLENLIKFVYDPDDLMNSSAKKTFQILSGSLGKFIISDNSIGELSFSRCFQIFELRQSYELLIRVSDDAGLFNDAIIHIDIYQPSSKPMFVFGNEYDHEATILYVSPPGTVVSGSLIGVLLENFGNNSSLVTVSISNGNIDDAFEISKLSSITARNPILYYQLLVLNSSAMQSINRFNLHLKTYYSSQPYVFDSTDLVVNILRDRSNFRVQESPKVKNITQNNPADTAGDFLLNIAGSNLNQLGMSICLSDPLSSNNVSIEFPSSTRILPMSIPYNPHNSRYQYSLPLISNNMRVYQSQCIIVFKSENLIQCKVPAGLGVNLSIIMRWPNIPVGTAVNFSNPWLLNSFPLLNTSIDNIVSYDQPEVIRVNNALAKDWSDANGGDVIKIEGRNFGAIFSPSVVLMQPLVPSISTAKKFASSSVRDLSTFYHNTINLDSTWLAGDPSTQYSPYLQCKTQKTTVGRKALIVAVAYQKSIQYNSFSTWCKVNYYGMEGT